MGGHDSFNHGTYTRLEDAIFANTCYNHIAQSMQAIYMNIVYTTARRVTVKADMQLMIHSLSGTYWSYIKS